MTNATLASQSLKAQIDTTSAIVFSRFLSLLFSFLTHRPSWFFLSLHNLCNTHFQDTTTSMVLNIWSIIHPLICVLLTWFIRLNILYGVHSPCEGPIFYVTCTSMFFLYLLCCLCVWLMMGYSPAGHWSTPSHSPF